jgi:putative Ca2+/H+ antiporter (TMEM165/GDT1 family)
MKHSLLYLCFTLAVIFVLTNADATITETPTETPKPEASGASKKTVFSAFVQSFSSIVVSELGDKTFFIAAIMSMRYNRIAVLSGALTALFLMTAISTAFGVIVTVIPKNVTHILITVLFFFFGGKLLYDAYTDDGEENDEAAEVEVELNQMHSKLVKKSDAPASHQEAQFEYVSEDKELVKRPTGKDVEATSPTKLNCATHVEKVATKLVFWQALTMTFLGEWGDRSQFTTIALAVSNNAWFVFIGSFLGHVLCTSLAVVGGKYLAEKISERTVNICGGILFLLFGVHNLFVAE